MMLLKYWKPLAIALLIALIFAGGYANGVAHVKAQWTAEKLKQAEIDLATKAEQEAKLAEAEKKATDMRTKYRSLYAKLKPNNCPAGDGVHAINEAVRISR